MVNHKIWLSKMKIYGMSGCVLDWFASYLNERKLQVKINECICKEFEVVSGKGHTWVSYFFVFMLIILGVHYHLSIHCLQTIKKSLGESTIDNLYTLQDINKLNR